MAKLNDIAKNNLAVRRDIETLKKPAMFSIIFLGDPHVGMDQRTNGTGCNYNNTNDYRALLRSIDSTDKSLIAVFNGGDGADNSGYVKSFTKITEDEMAAKTVKNIPFFSGVGNHEYQGDLSLSNYRAYISSKTNDVIQLYGTTFGPKAAVIMLDTGGPETDGCTFTGTIRSGGLLRQSIAQIESSREYQSAIKDKEVKFIIDMHIPPCLPGFYLNLPPCPAPPPPGLPNCNPNDTHILCPNADNHFSAFVNRIGHSRILTIVSHHKHGWIQGRINCRYRYRNTNIPVFLTAQGGNCDPAVSADTRSRLSYYNFIFHTAKPTARSNYDIAYVYRLDVNPATGTVYSRPGIQIYP